MLHTFTKQRTLHEYFMLFADGRDKGKKFVAECEKKTQKSMK